MDKPLSSPSTSDLGSRVIDDWAPIVRGDIREVTLSDYAVDSEDPTLPLLAAGIRGTRRKWITWRSAVLLLLIVAGAAYVVQSMRTRAVQEPLSPAVRADQVPAEPPPPSSGTASVGTSGQNAEPRPTVKEIAPDGAHASASDDEMIRQGIARFTAAYSRWTPLAFGSCDISRGGDSATVTCLARGAQPSSGTESGGTWMFTFRRIDDGWKIVSIQPPPDSP